MTTTSPDWAHGFDLDELREVSRLFQRFDRPYILGAFSRVSERNVAEWRKDGQLDTYAMPHVSAASAASRVRVRQPIRDFTGEVRAYAVPGDTYVRRVAYDPDGASVVRIQLRDAADRARAQGWALWLEGWRESPEVEALARVAGMDLVAVKVKASSELVGVWAAGNYHLTEPLAPAEVPTLVRLCEVPPHLVSEAASEVVDVAGWADHYSTYNKRHAWSALALRTYGLEPSPPPDQIVKPAEMAKAWKLENPGWEAWSLDWTELADRLPAVQRLLRWLTAAVLVVNDPLAQPFDRVRLMRLEPGGGELTRHADITDPDAGTAPGKVARLHFPLITNPGVLFRQWRLDGQQVEAHMATGELWYLDTRKPHRAGNYGDSPRLHLVVDAHMTDDLARLIEHGTEAAVVEDHTDVPSDPYLWESGT